MLKKEQGSVEILVGVGAVLFVFLVISALTLEKSIGLSKIESELNKEAECRRISNIITSLYNLGPGSRQDITTSYVINLYGNNLLGIGQLTNFTETGVGGGTLAILASEAGPSSQDFYDIATNRLDPEWYKVCFESIFGSGCQQWTTEAITEETWDSINKTLDDLVAELGNYRVIYLEDPTLLYDEEYNGKTYLQNFEEWAGEKGHSLILSEHIMCREKISGGSSERGNINCNPPGGYFGDIWDIFGHRIHQKGGDYHNNVTIINPAENFFPNMEAGQTLDFEEYSFIEQVIAEEVQYADDGIFSITSAGTAKNQGSHLNTKEEDCPAGDNIDDPTRGEGNRNCNSDSAWVVGYDGAGNNQVVEFNVTFIFDLSELEINGSDITSITFGWSGCWSGCSDNCDDGDNPEFRDGTNGEFEVLIGNGSSWERLNCLGTKCLASQIMNLGDINTAPYWGSADAYGEYKYNKAGGFSNNYTQDNNLLIRLRTWGNNHLNGDDLWQEIDNAYLDLDYAGEPESSSEFNPVGLYNGTNFPYGRDQPGILYWDYEEGQVFYFGDFQVGFGQQQEYSNIIADIIGLVYLTTFSEEIICPYLGSVSFTNSSNEKISLTGDIRLENKNNQIFASNLI